MNGIIIIDGCDATGKTTLAKEIIKQNGGGEYMHLVYTPDTYLYLAKAFTEAVQLAEKTLVVIDRGWLSEQVYARVYRHGSVAPQGMRNLDRMLLRAAALNILCVPESIMEVVVRHKELMESGRPEMYKEGIWTVAQQYYNLAHGHMYSDPVGFSDYYSDLVRNGGVKDRPDYMIYSLGNHHMGQFAQDALDYLSHWQWTQYPISPYWGIAGHYNQAKFLFIVDTPFPINGPGLFEGRDIDTLNKALCLMQWDETQAMWLSCEYNPPARIVKDLASVLTPVAIGEKAEAFLLPFLDTSFYGIPDSQLDSPADMANSIQFALGVL